MVGRLTGRHPIARGSSKTVEGTAAAAVATMAAWAAVLSCCGGAVAWPGGGGQEGPWRWVALAGATLLSCLTEALTTQLDNIFVPAHYYALLCLL